MNSIIKYKSYLSDYLMKYHDVKNLNDFFHCLNPNHVDKNPSMRFTSKYNICHCFSCSANYDIFDLVGIDFHINNFKDQIAKVEEYIQNIFQKISDSQNPFFTRLGHLKLCRSGIIQKARRTVIQKLTCPPSGSPLYGYAQTAARSVHFPTA